MIFIVVLIFFLIDSGFAATNPFGFKYQMIRGNSTHTKVEEIVKEEDLAYPRNNENSRSKIEKSWANYYKCLEQKVFEERKPELVRLVEGQSIQFYCDICIKPFQDFSEIIWKYKPLAPDPQITKMEFLDLAPQMMFTPNKTLQIYNAIQDFEGVYACYHGKSVESMYILEVSKNDSIEEIYSSYLRSRIPLPVEGLELEIKYKWGGWTECSSCNTVGKRYKYGNCMTVAKKPQQRDYRRFKRISKSNVSEFIYEKYEYVKNIVQRKNLFNNKINLSCPISIQNLTWLSYVLEKFKSGIPCGSPILPEQILERTRNFISVKALSSYCLISCQDSVIFEIVDAEGNAVEIANNSAGIYSVFQKLPQLPPEIERRSLEGDSGSDITIQCPSSLLTTVPVTWKIHQKTIFPKILANESSGRVTVDPVQRIVIKKLRLKDEHIYSCWQRDKLVGTVNLHVNKKLKIGYNHHVILVGILALVGLLLFIGVKLIKRELRARN